MNGPTNASCEQSGARLCLYLPACSASYSCSIAFAVLVAASLCVQPVYTKLLDTARILPGLLDLLCQLPQFLCFACNCCYSLTLVACMACAPTAPLLDEQFWPNCHQLFSTKVHHQILHHAHVKHCIAHIYILSASSLMYALSRQT